MSVVGHTSDDARNDSGRGYVRQNGIFLGIVKDNVDVQRMGRLRVHIPELGSDPENQNTWYTVSYASPFAGATDINQNSKDGEDAKKMIGTQTSYGFWAVPPDLNNLVLVCFINGDTARGVWFACLYQQFMNHMVPGIALNVSTDDEINEKNLPPVCEYNKKDPEVGDYWDPKRPVYEPLHNGLVEQGLYIDPERGPATTSARREMPSQVYGFLSPGGNTIHIDEDPDNEFIRLRTKSGVQIVVHETTGYIYMISKKGNSWFEISDDGIDMYSKRSISMRAEENINIHADQNIVMFSGGALHSTASNITQRSSGQINQQAEGTINRDSPTITDNTATPESGGGGDSGGGEGGGDTGGGEGGGGTPGSGGGGTPGEGGTPGGGTGGGGTGGGTPGSGGGGTPSSADEYVSDLRVKTGTVDGRGVVVGNVQTQTLGQLGAGLDNLQQTGGQAFAGGFNDPRVTVAAATIQRGLGNDFSYVSAQNDVYHQRSAPTSGHTRGTKLDIVVNGSLQSADRRTGAILEQTYGMVRGVDFVIDSRPHGTGPHLDIAFTRSGLARIDEYKARNFQ